MRSPRGVVAALLSLLGVALALITGIALGDGAENVLHLAMAATFLLQGAGDLMHSASLQHLAYEVLGQRVEKILGYAFLLWCVAMLFSDSTGKTKAFGVVVLIAIFFIEIYTIVTAYSGGEGPGVLKLFYVPLFIWLLLEGLQHRANPLSPSLK
jgi:hypothetical protein